jgi:hypothetical protein
MAGRRVGGKHITHGGNQWIELGRNGLWFTFDKYFNGHDRWINYDWEKIHKGNLKVFDKYGCR